MVYKGSITISFVRLKLSLVGGCGGRFRDSWTLTFVVQSKVAHMVAMEIGHPWSTGLIPCSSYRMIHVK